jgi:hypothetical protein
MGASPPWTTALHEALARVGLRQAREALVRGETERTTASPSVLMIATWLPRCPT